MTTDHDALHCDGCSDDTHNWCRGIAATPPAPLDVERLVAAIRAWGGAGHTRWSIPAWPPLSTRATVERIAAEYARLAREEGM